MQWKDKHDETKYYSSLCYSVIIGRPAEFLWPKKVQFVSAELHYGVLYALIQNDGL
jgi:hypothetical protein